MTFLIKLSLILFCLALTNQYELTEIRNGRIETCRGCSLNRLPEVKDFVYNDAPKYERVMVEFITGAKPELVLLGEGDVELDRLPLSQLTRAQCNQLLEEKGFHTKSTTKADL